MKRVQLGEALRSNPSKIQKVIGTSFDNQIDLEKLHLNSQWSDVKFLFDSGNGTAFESIPANKVILAAQSDVFAAMFFGELKEKGDITMKDASIGGFKEFLQFFHLNRVHLTMENVAEVMDLGHKYNVTKCVDACAKFLMGAITADRAFISLSLALLYDRQDLKEYCEKYIVSNSNAVLKSKSFLECDKPMLAHLLKMDSLFCSETLIFEACMEWIKVKSQRNKVTKQLIREHLGELFYDFRFTSMKLEEFDALCTSHEYAFTFAEYKDIMQTLTSLKTLPTLFNKNPRLATCNRNIADSNSAWWYLKHNKPTQFELNQPMLLEKLVFAPISIYRQLSLDSDFPIDVTIIESSKQNKSTRVLSNVKISLPSRKETAITLPAPVHVKPGFNYEIRLNPLQSTDEHGYECKYLLDKVEIVNDLIIKFRGEREIKSNQFVSLITRLGFNEI